jgi:hypothetical protein
VFLVEYFGPLWIHPLFYFFPQFFYSAEQTGPKHLIQTFVTIKSTLETLFYSPFNRSSEKRVLIASRIALGCVLFHYLKREFETVFVHRFSNATMPWFNIIKNSTHYWYASNVTNAQIQTHRHCITEFFWHIHAGSSLVLRLPTFCTTRCTLRRPGWSAARSCCMSWSACSSYAHFCSFIESSL